MDAIAIPPQPSPVEQALQARINHLEQDLDELRREQRFNRQPVAYEDPDRRAKELRDATVALLVCVGVVVILRRINWMDQAVVNMGETLSELVAKVAKAGG